MGADLIRSAREALRDSSLAPVTSSAPYVSDAGRLAALGVPTLLFGPGRGLGDLYRDDERVPIAHLHAACDAYSAIIERLCCEG